ncbi:hypothetical protein F4779DRAFT_618591 [Xylariaceae sp. FL0662B]|nr:hypothetical protein F4779DRAFT_618591 [Xylariaceae sp. FL0662B]
MEELITSENNASHSVQGHKANLLNPRDITQREGSKENSYKHIEEMGGEAAHYGNQDKPRSNNAAEELEYSRAMAVK